VPARVPPTATTMRLDGGHPALELVNTVYGTPEGHVEHDVLAGPRDLVEFARRLGMASAATPADAAALQDVRTLRDAFTTVMRSRLADAAAPAAATATLEAHARAAFAAARLTAQADGFAWTWSPADAHTPVHRLAIAVVELLTGPDALLVRGCAGCNWLFVDRSRGPGRIWCSMADCGTEAKKRRYVQRRRERRNG
jgi:predicted RNA-binding Zn ribbon-like protein